MRSSLILVAVALLLVLVPTHLVAQDNGVQVFNVKASYGGQPGALGNDTGDDGPAIQRAINAASAAHGGIVFLPAGKYRLASGLSMGGGITLEGTGWNRDANNAFGTWLHVTSSSFTPISITFDGSGVRDLAITHDQPVPGPGWAPNLNYPYTIQLNGGAYGVFIHDVLLLNPTRGVLQSNANGGVAGALHIDRLYGQPLYRGIEIQSMEDVMHVNNVHFGPVWSVDPNVFTYTRGNAIAITSYRNDEPHFQDIFLFEYQMGFLFSANSSGTTGRFNISDLHCDTCWEGIRIWASNIQGKVSNLDVYNGGYPGSVGVHVIDSHDVLLLLSNVHIVASGAPVIYVHRENAPGGTNPLVMVDNLIADGWDYGNQGWAALVAGANCNITAGFNRTFTAAHNNGLLTSGAVALGQ